MAKDFDRTRRIGALMKRELSESLHRELSTGRGIVTITEVTVRRDLSDATVYFTVLGDDIESTQKFLTDKSGLLRHLLSQRIKIRKMPHLTFTYDESVERGRHLSALIDEVSAKENKPQEDSADS
ncbi:MAG: 30S ribosome-binding factor RbfA [Pseudomonadota bacterium]